MSAGAVAAGRKRPHDAGRACLPAADGFVERPDGVRIAYEVFGAGEPTIVMLPSSPIVHSRQWKAQVPFLSRSYRVVTYDGRGNGRSDRPTDPDLYEEARIVGDLEAVLDATGTRAAVLVGLCSDGVWRAIELASSRPARVLGIVAFAVGVPLLSPPHPWRGLATFDEEQSSYEGWAKENGHYWSRDYPGFVDFFFHAITSEPHSTKQIEDSIAWALEGSVEAMLAEARVPFSLNVEDVERICRSVRCRMLLVHGTDDHCQPIARAYRLAALTGAPLIVVEGADHLIPARHPVMSNLLIRDFVAGLAAENAR
jgi:pimeloyl-ACP methyl ester carboxylesterase